MFSFILLLLSSRRLVFLFYSIGLSQSILIDWELFHYNGSIFCYSILFDWVSLRFLFTVFLISRIVIYYRHRYIRHDVIKNAFAFIVFLFVASIIFLIISPSLLRVILGWDGLGLVSYLLVIYYQNYKRYSAGLLTCLTNRLGDRALLISMGWFLRSGSLDFVFYYSSQRKEILFARAFVVLAGMTKRAQIPFSAWLPAAIAAPTPVSALVHSSTLVTAGVYLILRFFPLFQFRFMKTVLLFRATLTIMISSLGALYETDLKKVIALSTLRQLGLIMIALRIEMYLLAFFHLLTHALFKASLFLCAGRIIHLYGGRQDIRNLSAVVTYIPLTTTCLLVCSLSLGGFPFLAAFYSKDKIIEETLRSGYNPLLLSLLAISILLTIMYSFRLVYHIACRSCEINYLDIKDDKIIVKSILILTLGGIVGGSFFSWSIFDTSYDNLFLRAKSLILLFLLLGLFRGLVLSISSFRVIRFYLREIWFLPAFRTKLTTLGGLSYSSSRFKYWDCGWNEVVGPKGLRGELSVLTNKLDRLNHFTFKNILFVRFFILVVLILFF